MITTKELWGGVSPVILVSLYQKLWDDVEMRLASEPEIPWGAFMGEPRMSSRGRRLLSCCVCACVCVLLGYSLSLGHISETHRQINAGNAQHSRTDDFGHILGLCLKMTS